MHTSLFAFATDFHDEGLDLALDRIGDRAGVDGVAVASVYHHGRDIFPHSPVRRVRFLEGGTAFFRPTPERYAATSVKPVASALAQQWDALGALREATAARDMELHAWTVFFHNTRLGSEHPEAAVRNVFGDPQLTYLCPANPAAVGYAQAVAGDIARYGVDSLLAESLHYHPLEHGFHHERYLIDIGPVDRLLLGLCFCAHCRAFADERGVDTSGLIRAVHDRLERFFDTAAAFDASEADREHLATLWDGELDAYLRAREEAVAVVAAAVADELEGTDTRFAFMDQAGAIKGYADGKPVGGPAPEVSWQLGVDAARIGEFCDEFQLLAYAHEPDRVRDDIAAYRALLPSRCELRAAFRPIPPDCQDADNLRRKLTIAAAEGVVQADLYHYGFARLETLDLIRAAITS